MSVFVLIAGSIILLFGIASLIAPSIIKYWFNRMTEWRQFHLIAVLRIVIGILFLLAANETRFPLFVTVMGVISLLSGLAIPIAGVERVKTFAKWGIERSDTVLRLWVLVASVVGFMLVWAGLE